MGVRSKTLVTILLIGAVVGVVSLQTNNSSLLKGQLNKNDINNQTQEEIDAAAVEKNALPDLKASLVIIEPEAKDGDIVLDVTIENLGPGEISGETPFVYAVYLNDVEVFSNMDSYSTMIAGDAFNFKYPVSKLIYQYPNKGTAKVVLDRDEVVKETNEDNNTVELNYEL